MVTPARQGLPAVDLQPQGKNTAEARGGIAVHVFRETQKPQADTQKVQRGGQLDRVNVPYGQGPGTGLDISTGRSANSQRGEDGNKE